MCVCLPVYIYRPKPVDDTGVKEAAKFAVDNEYTKVGGYKSYVIKSAEQQVIIIDGK